MFKAKKLLEKIAGWRNGIKPGALMRNLPVYLFALRLFHAWNLVARKSKILKKYAIEVDSETQPEFKDSNAFGAYSV